MSTTEDDGVMMAFIEVIDEPNGDKTASVFLHEHLKTCRACRHNVFVAAMRAFTDGIGLMEDAQADREEAEDKLGKNATHDAPRTAQ